MAHISWHTFALARDPRFEQPYTAMDQAGVMRSNIAINTDMRALVKTMMKNEEVPR
jgi:hypothetical protein